MASGDYFLSFVTNIPADLTTSAAKHYEKTILRFPEEAIFVYSFREQRMIYAAGWENVLGYKDEEIGICTIVNTTSPKYLQLANALNDEVFTFIQGKFQDLEQYSFMMELEKIHKEGHLVPMVVNVGVLRSENGRIIETIGRYKVNRRIKLGEVMQYAAYGPEKSEFEEELNKRLFHYYAISEKEKEALKLVSKGYSFKEIAFELKVSQSAIEKRIIPMYKRFNVRSLPHLISFAYDNHILP